MSAWLRLPGLDLIAELLVGLAVFPLSFERQGFVDVWQAVELEAKFTRIAAYGYGCPAVVTQAMVTPFPTSTSVGYDISDFFGRVLWPAPRPFFLEALLSSGDLSAAMYLQSSIPQISGKLQQRVC